MIEAEQQKIENEKARQELISAYKRLFKTSDGKIVLKKLRSVCGQDRSSVCEQSPNLDQTLYCEGKRSVFLHIQSYLGEKK